MPRIRNSNFTLLIIIFGIVFLLWLLTGSPAHNSYRDFRRKTENAMTMKDHMTKLGKPYLSDSEMLSQTQDELQGILKQQHQHDMTGGKDSTEDPSDESVRGKVDDDTEEVSIAGRKKMAKQKEQMYNSDAGRYSSSTNEEEDSVSKGKANDPGREAAREELQRLLKRSPIVIFSKSTCPYSKRAKNLLLNSYKITPAPFVVELDLMIEPAPTDGDSSISTPVTMGRKLQDLLAEITGRKTVPNIMMGIKSLGGCDEVVALDDQDKLAETIRKHGGKQIVEARRRMED